MVEAHRLGGGVGALAGGTAAAAQLQQTNAGAGRFAALVSGRAAAAQAAATHEMGPGMLRGLRQAQGRGFRGSDVVRAAVRGRGRVPGTDEFSFDDALDTDWDEHGGGSRGGGGFGSGGDGSDQGRDGNSGSGGDNAPQGEPGGDGLGLGAAVVRRLRAAAAAKPFEQGQHQGAQGPVAEQLKQLREMAARNQFMNLVYLKMQSDALDHQRLMEITANMVTIKHEVYLWVIEAWVQPFGVKRDGF